MGQKLLGAVAHAALDVSFESRCRPLSRCPQSDHVHQHSVVGDRSVEIAGIPPYQSHYPKTQTFVAILNPSQAWTSGRSHAESYFDVSENLELTM